MLLAYNDLVYSSIGSKEKARRRAAVVVVHPCWRAIRRFGYTCLRETKSRLSVGEMHQNSKLAASESAYV
jgi:hypothetical protein